MSVAVDLDAADRHRGASVVVWVTLAALVVFIVWAYSFELDEVASGTGKVVPTSRDQVIQSLEGGILSSLQVREGDTVEPGQVPSGQTDAGWGSNPGPHFCRRVHKCELYRYTNTIVLV